MLEEAFTSLLATKPYEKITVSDITRKADLNRGTFYAHFKSVDDLMRQTMDDITEKISTSFAPMLGDDFFDDPMPLLNKMGEFINENLSLTKKLVDSDRLEPLLSALFERIKKVLRERARSYFPNQGTVPLKIADYIVGGIVNVYGDWLRGNYGAETIDKVNEDLSTFIRATGSVLGKPSVQ